MATEQVSELKQLMETLHEKTSAQIMSLQTTLNSDIANIKSDLMDHNTRLEKIENDVNMAPANDKIEQLSLEIEVLKQDRLRNNVRITGLPQMAFDEPDDAILRIAEILNAELLPSDYEVHADRNKSSLILSFSSHSLKRHVMNQMRYKKSLMAEEIYERSSNSRIFINDQLSPYFAKLFQCAWRAKKEGKLFSASSMGGRVKIKKNENGNIHIIQTESQLNEIINSTKEPITHDEARTTKHQSQHSQQTTSHQDNCGVLGRGE